MKVYCYLRPLLESQLIGIVIYCYDVKEVTQYKKYLICAAGEMFFHSLMPDPLGSWIYKRTTL